MGPIPFHPEDSGPTPVDGDASIGGMTRVTFVRGDHRFEFKCDPGSEALLARAVLDLAKAEGSPLDPGEALGVCRQIEMLARATGNRATGADGGPSQKAA